MFTSGQTISAFVSVLGSLACVGRLCLLVCACLHGRTDAYILYASVSVCVGGWLVFLARVCVSLLVFTAGRTREGEREVEETEVGRRVWLHGIMCLLSGYSESLAFDCLCLLVSGLLTAG